MQSTLAIKQEEWTSPFLSIIRQDSLSCFLNMHSLLTSAPVIDQNLPKCKYCKAYPFTMNGPVPENSIKDCELCGSINEHQMRFTIMESSQEPLFINNSYILPMQNVHPKTFTLILYLNGLEYDEIQYFIEALKVICQALTVQTCILLTIGGKLAIVDFTEKPELVVLSKDINILEKIEENSCVLTPQMVQQLQIILLILNSQPVEVKKSNQQCAFNIVKHITSYFCDKILDRINIFVWIGKIPAQIETIPIAGLCTIAILTLNRKLENASLLMNLSLQFDQVHFISPPETATQLYYKLYEVLSQHHVGHIISGVVALRTSQKYSGILKGVPSRFINAANAPIQVAFDSVAQFKMQVCIQLNDQTGKHTKFVANCEPALKKRRTIWFQRVILISRALTHVKFVFSAFRKEGKDPGFDYFFITNQLQKFAEQFENKTQLYREILDHMNNYFKQFQKNPYKLCLPFSLMGRRQLLLVFYPLWQGGILHHWDGMWVDSEGQESVQWCTEFLGTPSPIREKKLPIFYQLCIENEKYCYIEQ